MVETYFYRFYYKLRLLLGSDIREIKTHNGVTYGVYRRGSTQLLVRGLSEEDTRNYIDTFARAAGRLSDR